MRYPESSDGATLARARATLVCVVLMAATLGGVSPGHAATVSSLGTVPSPVVNGRAGLYGWGAATLPDGTVIIGDIWNSRVMHYAKDGRSLGVLFRSGEVYGLGVDPRNGTVYVASSSCCTVQRFVRSASGAYSRGAPITNPNFTYPSRVTVGADGRVYIADMLEGKIYVYSPAGQLLFSFGSEGSAPGQLRQPRAMAFDNANRLYVVDAYNTRISVFTAEGRFLFAFGSQGTAPHQFRGTNIRGLAIDRARGWVYAVDMSGDVVKKFDLAGNWLMNIGGSAGQDAQQCCSTPVGKFSDGGREMTVDGNGNIWVGDMANFRAQAFSPTGTPLFAVPDPPQLPAPGGYNGPQGVAVDSAGNVIVSDTWNFRIQKLGPTGQFLWQRGVRGRFSGYALNYPRGIAADPRDGSIVVADNFSSLVKKYSANGTFLWRVGGQGGGPTQLNHPSQVAVGPDGTVYIADSWNERVAVYSAGGAFQRTIGSSAGFTLRNPRGVGVDPANGDLYVADYTGGAVYRLRSNGSLISVIGRDAGFGATLRQPNQVAVDGRYVYVTDVGHGDVLVYSKTTRAHVATITGVSGPQGIAVSNAGVVYVSERGPNRVSKWRVS